MGIVYETHVAIGGVLATTCKRVAAGHIARLRAHGTSGSTLDWSQAILTGLARSACDGLAVWGGGGKGLGSEVCEALTPFFRELLADHPDARIVYAEESDHDDGDDGDVARWTESSCSGLEEEQKEMFGERSLKIACRINAKEKYDDEEGDEEEGDAPLDVEGIASSRTWDIVASRVHVFGYAGLFDQDDVSRAAKIELLRDAASRTAHAHVGECLSALADATEGWKDAAWPSWCHVGTALDIGVLVDALRTLMFALVVYQPDADTMKVARVEESNVTHHDVPLGLFWSPAFSPTLSAPVDVPPPAPRGERPASVVAPSPHREAYPFTAYAASCAGGENVTT